MKIEQYSSALNNAFITKESGMYRVWWGGCGIGSGADINKARRLLFEYAQRYHTNNAESHKKRMEYSQTIVNTLKDDVYYMSKYLI